jgi:hypothetical protein
LSLGPFEMVVGSTTIAFATSATDPTFSMAADGSWVVVDGQTLRVGGPPITVSGKVISLGASGLVIGSSTIALMTPTPSQRISLAPDKFSAVVYGQTISSGGSAIIVSGTIISLGPSGIIFGSSTIPFGSLTSDTGMVFGTTATGLSANSSLQESPAAWFGLSSSYKYLIAFAAWLIWLGS